MASRRSLPIREDFPRSATNPYGRTKLIQEDILGDLAKSDGGWRIVSLRYFNPVGAHESGLIGEDPKGTPNNLMPLLLQVAIGRRPELHIFGGDYPTADGTCIRDFIHVQDLADGHLAALNYLQAKPGCIAVNLGAGKGVSVLEMCETFERATNHKLPRRIVARRPGDVAACWSDPSLAKTAVRLASRGATSCRCAAMRGTGRSRIRMAMPVDRSSPSNDHASEPTREPMTQDAVLVTGAAGFIGFHVAQRLLQQGRAVVGLDNMNAYYDPGA